MQKDNFINLFRTQIDEFSRGGAHVFLRKLFKLSLFPLALGIAVLVRLLSPFILIRFGMVNTARLGPYCHYPEMYLCQRDRGMWRDRRIFDIFYCDRFVCNYQLKKMWRRILFIPPFSRFFVLVDFINQYLPNYQRYRIPWFTWDNRVFLEFKEPHLFFTNKEKCKADIGIKKLGIPQNAPFVCFHSRDAAYLNAVMPGNDFNYHNYRDCSIDNYIPAIDALAKKGYFAVRMGAVVSAPLVTNNPMIIDYAINHRSDFMDIYLSAHCKFFIGSSSGIDDVSRVFRRPLLIVNFIPFGELKVIGPAKLLIPKKLWLKEEKRLLGFREIFNSDILNLVTTQQYDAHGIEVLENTPEEISAAVQEMETMVNGIWCVDEEAEELQKHFWSLSNNLFQGLVLPRIGTEFLRQNRDLLI